jgi:VIT1/CCC1 family predicted Fe2+/Mn2+ transporter
MVLTVTCSFGIARASQEGIREMIFAALGCNLVWGVIDATFYLIQRFDEQGRGILALMALRRIGNTSEAHSIIAETLPPLIASVLTPTEFELIHQRLNRIPEPPAHPQLAKDDWLAAVGVFLLVFLCTFPVVIPFLLLAEAKLALRVSNGVAILMLFLAGYALGGYAGRRRWLTGLVMVIVGGALVGACIALGG